MLHYLSFLSVEKTLTKESFIRLVLKWIKESPYASPMMKNAKWNGKYSYVVGDELERLEIREYKQILAVQVRKPGHKGLLWERLEQPLPGGIKGNEAAVLSAVAGF